MSQPAFRIEWARPGDEAAIAELIMALAEYEKAPEQCVATPEKVRAQLFGSTPAAEALIAWVDGAPAGFAVFFHSFSTWLAKPGLYLEDLFVKPAHRNMGIGGALLRRLAAIAVERDYGRMEWACLEWNELAKCQYRKIGAKPMEEWRTWRLTGEDLKSLAAEHKVEKPAAKKAIVESGEKITVYTDGGCQPNPGTGAWAAILVSGEREKEIVGGEHDTTNNRMELLAAINALEALRKPCAVEMHTDSQYVRNGITKWIHDWKRKKWIRAQNPIKNVDLWKRLDAAAARHNVDWHWVRGHSGHDFNDRCDELCGAEIARLKSAKA